MLRILSHGLVSITLNASFTLTLSAQVSTPPQPSETKANADIVYQQIRRKSESLDDFNGQVATVNGLVLRRDAATFKFNAGEIYFLTPVEGRTTGAVFLGDVEMTFTPPTDVERRSLSTIIESETFVERFTRLVMHFTDQTLQEIQQSDKVRMGASGSQAGRARDAYRDIQNLLRKDIRYNIDLRTLGDVYAPKRPGFFIAFPGGGRFDRLVYTVDPMGIPEVAPEQVALYSFSVNLGGIWAAFHLSDQYENGVAKTSPDRRLFDITHHEINGTIRGTRLGASDQITLRVLASGTRVLPFDLYRSLRVSRVKDEQGRELNFIQEKKDEDADFAVILPEAPDPEKVVKLTVEYEGEEAISDSGGGNFILIPRLSWYPNNAATNFGDRAIFNFTFRYPKDYIFVGTGALAGPEVQEGDVKIAKWTSGDTELAVAGFNYGNFKRKDLVDKETGYTIEFYANKEVPDELKELELYLDELARNKQYITGITGKFSTAGMADTALNDTQNATRIYSAYFGKLPYSRVAMTQQPAGNFGQAWPTLIYMPYVAFMDSNQRTQIAGAKFGVHSFWRYVGPHEAAHQWWGHAVGWESYRDQWMSEGFAEFSTSLYAQYARKDMAKFIDFWDEQRKLITTATTQTKGYKPYKVGPITQGYRLNSGKTPNIARALIYPKGAYVLHMIRMMMFDHRGGGDARFREMMTDFVKSHLNKNASTADFQRSVEKHMTPQMDIDKNARMDWFFNEWVYGTDVPAYRLDYSMGVADGKPALTLKVTQSGVSDDFKMLVPFYADFGKGWTRLGAVKLIGNSAVEIPNIPLPQGPKRVTIAALNDVLYTSAEVNKR